MPTIRKDARSVAAKREVVDRDRGWRYEGIGSVGSAGRGGNSRVNV